MKEKYWFNLQMFDGEGDGAGDGSGTGDGAGGQGNKGGEGDGNKGDKKPFIEFPDEASFMSRVGREAKKAQKEFLKTLGIEKEEDLADIVKAFRENEEKGKTELQRLKDAVEKANKDKDDALTKSQKVALDAEAKVIAIGLGIDPDKVKHALKLADFSEVKVEDGEVDSKTVKAAIEAVIKELPELVKKDGGHGKGGSNFNGNQDELLSMDVIKAMSAEEAEKRMPEIMKFLEKNSKK